MHNPRILTSWPISKKLLLLLLVIFLPALGTIVALGLEQRRDEIAKAQNSALLLVQSLAAQQQQIAIGTKQMLSTLAQLPEMQRLDADACNELFRELHNRNPFYSTIAAATPDGNMFAASTPFEPGSVNLSDRKHIKDAIKTLDFSAGEHIVGRVSKVQSLNYTYPVLDRDKNLIAIVIAGFKLNEYARFVSDAHMPEGYAMAITDHKGVRLYRLPENDATAHGKPIPTDSFQCASGDSEHGFFERTGEDGIGRIYAFKQLRLNENSPPYLYMFVGMPKNKILHKANLAMLSNLLILGIAAFLAMFLAWLLGNFALIRPINQLVIATQRFGKGEMGTRTDLPHTPDEVGQLAKSFDDMASLLEMRSVERDLAEEELQKARDDLEVKVAMRTAELARANETLKMEVAERRQAEERLRESEEIFNSFMEYSPIYVFFKDEEVRSIRLSRNYEKMIGRPLDEMLGKTMDELFPSELAKGIVEDDRRVLREGKPIEVIEEFNGRTYTTTKFPIVREGKPKLLAGFTIDITERKRAEQEKERLEEQLLQVQRMEAVGQLAGGVAHDFNNMLGVILGYTELLKMDIPVGSPLFQSVLEIEKAGIRSRDITSQLLAFSRKQIISPKPIDLNTRIENTQKTLARLIGEDIELCFHPEKNLFRVNIDPSQIDQILVNLAVNARDAMPRGGRLLMETQNIHIDEAYCRDHLGFEPGPYALLTVTDDGIGIDKEVLSRIFEPFFTTKEVGKGTGLGLATVYGIVKQNGGFINVYSEPGKGTAFKIYLPHMAGEEEELEKIEASTILAGTGTILLVEDEQILREMAVAMLQTMGYTVLAAGTPLEALSFFEKGDTPIDLLLTDVVMPEMSGKELAERIEIIKPQIKVLFMSGYSSNVIAHRGVLEEGLNFIQKPFSMDSLARKIGELIGNG